jgi:hypothetical protein
VKEAEEEMVIRQATDRSGDRGEGKNYTQVMVRRPNEKDDRKIY